ncbi:SDR family oxidoreductase [Actinosynnema sp. NPDC023794]
MRCISEPVLNGEDQRVDCTPTAIITGGTGGMGLATARLMGHDHRIVLADLDRTRLDDAARELAMAGVEALGVVCDITDKASVEQLFQRAESEGSHVRAVVHAAGISPHMGTAERIARINATGTVNIAGRKLKPGLAYAISKNFVHWYSRYLAAEFEERGALVVSISRRSRWNCLLDG